MIKKIKSSWSYIDSQVRQSPWISLIVACFSCSAVLIFGLSFVKHGNIPEGARKLTWELFSILLQGSLAGLIVLGCTFYYQKRQKHERLRAIGVLLLQEIHGHSNLLQQFCDAPETGKCLLNKLPDQSWPQVSEAAAELPYDLYEKIVDHYQNMQAARIMVVAPHVPCRQKCRLFSF